MNHTIKAGTLLLLLTVFAACKKNANPVSDEILMQKATTIDQEPAPDMPAGGHVAIGPFTGVGTPFFRYLGGAAYAPVIGALGNNILRRVAAGNPALPSVTGLAVRNQVGFCLAKTAAAANWTIWTFQLGNPNACTLYSTIGGTAAITLSDLEWDAANARFLVLNRSALRLTAVSPGPGAAALGLSGLYGGIVPNVSGLAVGLGAAFVLGQGGATGYIMRCNGALLPAVALAGAQYTPPAVPFAFTESGCYFDATLSNRFVVGSQNPGLNWALTSPVAGALGAFPPAWQATTRLIDFAPL